MNAKTIQGWIEKRGFAVSAKEPHLLVVKWSAPFAKKRPLPPLYVQTSDNWLVLSVLPVDVSPAYALSGLSRALLAINRKMPVVKFALGEQDEVVLCAELPTESLDEGELLGAMETLLDALDAYGDYKPLPGDPTRRSSKSF